MRQQLTALVTTATQHICCHSEQTLAVPVFVQSHIIKNMSAFCKFLLAPFTTCTNNHQATYDFSNIIGENVNGNSVSLCGGHIRITLCSETSRYTTDCIQYQHHHHVNATDTANFIHCTIFTGNIWEQNLHIKMASNIIQIKEPWLVSQYKDWATVISAALKLLHTRNSQSFTKSSDLYPELSQLLDPKAKLVTAFKLCIFTNK